VVNTGIGVVSPVGCTHDKFCPALVDGRSGIKEISIVPTERLVTPIAAETTDFKPEDYFTARQSMSTSFAFGGLNAVLVFAVHRFQLPANPTSLCARFSSRTNHPL